jgi:hypothetical protein
MASEGPESAADKVACDCEDRSPDSDRFRMKKDGQYNDHPQDCE